MVGALLGLPLCAMRLSRNHVVSYLAMALILTFRSIPPIVWLLYKAIFASAIACGRS